jgi:hypothetical protein
VKFLKVGYRKYKISDRTGTYKGILRMKWLRQEEIDADLKGCQSSARRTLDVYSLFALGMLILMALLLRLYAAADNFWLDEIFTYFLAMNPVHAVSDIFAGIKIEHQFLVTLSMYLLGDQLNWEWYRLPSVIMRTGTLALMTIVGYHRMSAAALIVMVAVAAVSYPLVVYSSETRSMRLLRFFVVHVHRYW